MPGATVSKEIESKVDAAANIVVEISSTKMISSTISSVNIFAIASVVIAIAVATVIMFVITNLISRPVIDISTAADRISEGELETKIPHQERDEIGILARSIERLRRSLQAAAESLEGAFR